MNHNVFFLFTTFYNSKRLTRVKYNLNITLPLQASFQGEFYLRHVSFGIIAATTSSIRPDIANKVRSNRLQFCDRASKERSRSSIKMS